MPTSRRLLAKAFVDRLQTIGSSKELARSLAAYLIEHKRTGSADMLIGDIVAELANRGQVLAEVTTAKALTGELRSDLVLKIKSITDAEKVELIEHIDPAIIGGVRLSVPGRELDASIKRQLQQLRV